MTNEQRKQALEHLREARHLLGDIAYNPIPDEQYISIVKTIASILEAEDKLRNFK